MQDRELGVRPAEAKATEERGESRRDRPRPRSKLIEAIAVLLMAKPMRAAEIAEVLGYDTRYVSSYLSYWRVRGLFDYENGFWVLTPQGEEFARDIIMREMDTRFTQYATLARQLLSKDKLVRQKRNNKRTAASESASGALLSFTASKTSKGSNKLQEHAASTTSVACLRAFIEEEELTSDEKEVLDALITHYAKWGKTYIYLDQLEEMLEADRGWLMRVARLLQTKGLIYIYNDRRLGTRIGFSRRLRELIAACSE